MLQVTVPAQFERFATEVGQPAREPRLPTPSAPDVPQLVIVAGRYGSEIIGLPPGHRAVRYRTAW